MVKHVILWQLKDSFTEEEKTEIKLDSVNAINGCRVLVTNQRISVTCASGSDAYLHAVTITAK